ncbi:MAG: accessory factor UbiK family protein [Pseudomonadota bacterium]
MAIDGKFIDELAQKLSGLVPPGVKDLQQDVEKNMRAVLQGAFTRMDLVTREEFDVQTAVLARTRAKLEQLEKQVAELETRLKNQ